MVVGGERYRSGFVGSGFGNLDADDVFPPFCLKMESDVDVDVDVALRCFVVLVVLVLVMTKADAILLEEARSAKQMDAKNVIFIVDAVLCFLLLEMLVYRSSVCSTVDDLQ